jgi:peptide/nickel transport system permease protein
VSTIQLPPHIPTSSSTVEIGEDPRPAPALHRGGKGAGGWGVLSSIARSPRWSGSLVVGLLILLTVLLFSVIGTLVVNPADGIVGAVTPSQRPSAQHWLGTDSQGRDMLTIMVLGTPQTLRIGLIAGVVGVTIGLVLGLISGYFGGVVDTVVRLISDALMTVPGIAVLLVIAVNVGHMTVELMGLTVAVLSWMYPTRSIRSQVLSIRERPYIAVARANGASELQVVFREIMPNLLPFIAASFIAAVNAAMLASIGLEALGLGANDVHTLGTTIFWAQKYSAVLRGQWWWFGPPIAMIATIFIGMFFVSVGVDRFANPRLRQQT